MKVLEIVIEELHDHAATVRVVDRSTQRIILDRAFVSPEAPELLITVTHTPKGCALEIRQRALQFSTLLQAPLR